MMVQDPWDWTNEKKQSAPLANTIQPVQASQEQAPAPQRASVGPLTGLTQQILYTKGINEAGKGIDKGIEAYKVATNPAAVSEEAFQLADASQLANQGLEAGQIASTIGGTAAPLSTETAGALGTAAETAALAEGGATAAGTAGALSAAAPAAATALGEAGAAGTVAATNAWNPVGWAAMAYLGGKALKLW
jgi:hypothetical protein